MTQATLYDIDRAADVGYLDEIVAPEEVVERAVEVATQLAELPAGAYAANKMGVRQTFADAIAAYRRLLGHSDDRKRADLFYHMGELHEKQGSFAQAIGAYGSVIELTPSHPRGYDRLAAVHIEIHEWPEARKVRLTMEPEFQR